MYRETKRTQMLNPTKLSITIDEESKVFHDKPKFTQYLSRNLALQKNIDGKLQHKEGNYTIENQERNLLSTNPKEESHTNIIPPLTTKVTGNNQQSLVFNIS
jgi:hypothetical protein